MAFELVAPVVDDEATASPRAFGARGEELASGSALDWGALVTLHTFRGSIHLLIQIC